MDTAFERLEVCQLLVMQEETRACYGCETVQTGTRMVEALEAWTASQDDDYLGARSTFGFLRHLWCLRTVTGKVFGWTLQGLSYLECQTHERHHSKGLTSGSQGSALV